MLDKDSNWDNTNGLKTLINTALTFGILGYPFILPDMIGGNAYSGMKPDRELFIRWLQSTSLMPAMQFSIVPWQYDEEVINITQKFVKLHEEYSNLIIDLANEAVQTGAPIIRPLWWISPLDEESQITDSEFLLGNNTLVAPILEQNARSRNIYLPAGKWKDSKHGRIIQGPKYLREYSVQLDELPIFTRITV
jgi:alpha-glucosidase (family GH31 glycosyl hydrolase)